MGDVHLERRLALLFLRVVAADGNASEEELAAAAEHLAPALEPIGARVDAQRLLRRTADAANDDALVEETIAIFADHVPPEVLASLGNQLADAASADGEVAQEEADVLNAILSAWQLGGGGEHLPANVVRGKGSAETGSDVGGEVLDDRRSRVPASTTLVRTGEQADHVAHGVQV
jgi:uncharacterized tellurite resistance protein B-like protein